MKKLRLYLDTTIWNFPFQDQEPDYKKATLRFFDKVRWGVFEVYFSDAVADELEPAPKEKREKMFQLLEEIAPQRLLKHPEVERLATLYRTRKVLPVGSVADSLHVAYATYYSMDALLSWNFEHLANMNRKAKVNALNMEEGYNLPLNLVNPLEVLDNDKDE